MDEQATVNITFGENFSFNCRIVETHEDFVKVNLLSFNKAERAFNTTPNFYFIPLGSIIFIEEPRLK